MAGIPRNREKYGSESLLRGADVFAARQAAGQGPVGDAPETMIFCFQPALLRAAKRRYRGRAEDGFFAEVLRLRRTNGRFAVAGSFGVGAPVVAVLLEEFAAWGVRRFLSVGIAGGLQPELQPGDVVVPTTAIRDEGTSHHYAPADVAATPSDTLTSQLTAALAAAAVPFVTGTTWSTDAPYRETAVEVTSYQQQGVQVVEMETAALFTVARILGVAAATVLVVSDSLANGRWSPAKAFHPIQQKLETILDAFILHTS